MAKDPTAQERRSTKVEAMLQEKTWSVWEHVREHRHSLDSERACRLIREAIDAACEETRRALVDSEERNKYVLARNRNLRKENAALKERMTMTPSATEGDAK